jgi:type IV pilus assembly protein PilO
VRRISFFDWFSTASLRLKLVVSVLALAVLGGVGYFIAVLPVETRLVTLRAQRATQQEELGRLRALAVELARVRREAAEVERQLETANEKLPTEREIPALYRTLSDAAVQAGLAVALFQPQGPRVHDFYSEIPISVVAQGGYHEVGDFVGRVATLPRATMVGELKLTGPTAVATRPGPAGPARGLRAPVEENRPRASVTDAGKPRRSVRAEITLLTYVYRPVGSPPAPKPAGAATKSDAAKP